MSGLTMGPDGRIYWSVADKGINATGRNGERIFYPDRGGIMRCEPDGSNLEIFALGVRNGQEPVFDEFGNLFSVDNDGDYPGERERFIHIVEGGMTAWRLHWQWFGHQDFARVSGEKPYNVWMQEGLFRTRFPGQAAFIVPPLANYSNGPCGLAYDPGTALGKDFRNSFFLAQGRKMTAFRVRPKGAAFEMYDERTIPAGGSSTGVAFGPDGALYVTDWMNGPSERGRIWKIDSTEGQENPARKRTSKLLSEGMTGKDETYLAACLAEPDLRVRKAAQFELVRRKKTLALLAAAREKQNQLPRLHAIWGIGQIARGWPDGSNKDAGAVAPLLEFLADGDPEVRAQAAKVLGESAHSQALEPLVGLLEDPSLRVRFHAAVALGKLKSEQAVQPLLELVRENDDEDAFLRHGAVMGLVGSTKSDPEGSSRPRTPLIPQCAWPPFWPCVATPTRESPPSSRTRISTSSRKPPEPFTTISPFRMPCLRWPRFSTGPTLRANPSSDGQSTRTSGSDVPPTPNVSPAMPPARPPPRT